jgi:hypothetical protein
MRRRRNNLPLFEHDDAIRPLRSRQAMGDHECDPPLGKPIKRSKNMLFRRRIQVGCRFIEDEDRSVFQGRA